MNTVTKRKPRVGELLDKYGIVGAAAHLVSRLDEQRNRLPDLPKELDLNFLRQLDALVTSFEVIK